MRTRIWDTVSVASLAVAAAVTALVYERLPDPLPTHFDIHGTPNGWMPRAAGAWFMPAFALALWAIVRFVPRLLPKRDKARIDPTIMALVAALVTVVLCAVHGVVLAVGLGVGVPVTKLVLVLVSGLFVALGLLMPRIRRNPILGVRTAWTLTSDENWARTHRVAGYAMVGGGLAAAIAALAGGTPGAVLAVICVIASGLVPVAYSFLLARRTDSRS
jgi:uncharacterized membrane protein